MEATRIFLSGSSTSRRILQPPIRSLHSERPFSGFMSGGRAVGKSVEGGEDSSAVGVGDFLKAFFSSGERMTAQEVTIVPSGLFSAVSLCLL